MKKYGAYFITITLIAAALFVVNILIYQIPHFNEAKSYFIYSIPELYLFFYVFTIIIMGSLIAVKRKKREQLGYAFLLLTVVKMGLCYLFIKPVLDKPVGNGTEKINFFIVFILFLAIEAYYTARLLNEKPATGEVSRN